MGYEAVDDGIRAWASKHRLALNTEFGGQPRRFCYVSGGNAESFQISIEPPESGIITVNAWDVETSDDAELHREWQVPISDLGPTLEEAVEQISRWARRARQT